jgi:hypothetical protein
MNSGYEEYAPTAYPMMFAAKYGFQLKQLATSAARAEDFHYILEVGMPNAYEGDQWTHTEILGKDTIGINGEQLWGADRWGSTDVPDAAVVENFRKSVTEADLDKVAKAASALNRGDAFYFGAMDKSALSLTADYQQDLVLSKASFTTNEIKLDYLDDETAMFIFEHTKVESKQEKTVLETAFAGMISYLKDYLKKKVFIDYEMEYAMLDDSHTMLSITTFKGRLDSILHQLPLSVGEGISFDLTPSYDAAIRENMMKEIALKMSFSKVIEDELLMKDIALKDHETVLSRASYRDFINTIVVEDLLLVRKEQDHA